MSVQFCFELPTMRADRPSEFISGPAIAELAAAGEAAGFSGCFVTDHPAGDANWLDHGGHHALDPFVALSFAAAATTNLRLLTNVYIAAYRNPFLSAKSVLSIDLLSGGRFILGTAAGYLKAEYRALGVDFDERGELLDEAIEVMKACWTGQDVAYEGRHFSARGVRMLPTPVARPHPPIWIGGNTRVAIRRAVTFGQGWAPFVTFEYAKTSRTASIDSIEQLVERIDFARSVADEVGRTEPFDICFSGAALVTSAATVEERRDRLGRLEAAGVTWLVVGFPGHERSQVLDGLHAFAAEMIA